MIKLNKNIIIVIIQNIHVIGKAEFSAANYSNLQYHMIHKKSF